MNKEIKYGQKIIINNKLIRCSQYNNEDYPNKEYKFWSKQPIKEREVIFLGFRYLTNGISEWTGEKIIYYPKEQIKVALVSENTKLNPYYTKL